MNYSTYIPYLQDVQLFSRHRKSPPSPAVPGRTRRASFIKFRLSIARMCLHILDRTAPVDMDLRRFPEARERELEARPISLRVDGFLREVHECLMRHLEGQRLPEEVLRFPPPLLVCEMDLRLFRVFVIADPADVLAIADGYAVCMFHEILLLFICGFFHYNILLTREKIFVIRRQAFCLFYNEQIRY